MAIETRTIVFQVRLHYKGDGAILPIDSSGELSIGLPVNTQLDVYSTDGRPKSGSSMRNSKGTVFSNTKWCSYWGRTIDTIDLTQNGAFAIGGVSVWANIAAMGWTDKAGAAVGKHFPKKLGGGVATFMDSFTLALKIPVGNHRPTMFGLSFRDKRMAFVFYPNGSIINASKYKYDMTDVFRAKSHSVSVDDVVVPCPVNAFYPEGSDTAYQLADVVVNVSVPDGIALGEVIRTQGLNQTAELVSHSFDWANLHVAELNTNPFTAVAQIQELLIRDGVIAEGGGEEAAQISMPMDEKAIIGTSVDPKGKERMWLKIGTFQPPEGIDHMPDPPVGHEWAINVLGLVFLLDKGTGRVHPLHEVFEVKNKRIGQRGGKVYKFDAAGRRDLLALYQHQIEVLRGLAFSYGAFADEIEQSIEKVGKSDD